MATGMVGRVSERDATTTTTTTTTTRTTTRTTIAKGRAWQRMRGQNHTAAPLRLQAA